MFAAREAAIWELEEQHLKDKAQLAQRQLRDLYFLKRHQMITRHEKVSIRGVHKKINIFATWVVFRHFVSFC